MAKEGEIDESWENNLQEMFMKVHLTVYFVIKC